MSPRRKKKSSFGQATKAIRGALTKMNRNMHKGLSTRRQR